MRRCFWLSLALGQSLFVHRSRAVYVGCFKDDGSMSFNDDYTYQSESYCSSQCSGSTYFAMSKGSQCFCSSSPPSQRVDDSMCDQGCNGYPDDKCGGNGYLSLYASTQSDADAALDNASSGSSSSSTSSWTQWSSSSSSSTTYAASSTANTTPSSASSSPSSSASPFYIYVTASGGATVTKTAEPTATSTPSASSVDSKEDHQSSGLGSGAAAGIAVAIVVTLAVLVGGFFFWRWRKRQIQKSQESLLEKNNKNPFTPRSVSDNRLDGELLARSNSRGSFSDDQDYSRKILRVTNPS